MNKKKPPQQNQKRKQVTFEDDDFLFANEAADRKDHRILGVKSEYMVFYIAAAIAGLILIFVGALGVFNLFSGISTPANYTTQTTTTAQLTVTPPEPSEIIIHENLSTLTALVTNVDQTNRILSLYNTTTRENENLFATTSSDFRGRFNQMMVFSEINIGDIVEVTYNPDNNNLARLQILDGDSVWEHRFVSGLSVDLASRTIILDGEMYLFNNATIIMNQGTPYDIANLGPLTMVTMRGIDSTVWYIEVERGFGSVQFLNNSSIIDGFIEIGREASVPIGSGVNPLDQIVQLSEGSHIILVQGLNIANHTEEITVINGETIQIDLSELEIIAGALNINVVPSSAAVTINGLVTDVSQPLMLGFGPIRVVAQYQGYVAFDEVIEFEEHNQLLPIVLLAQPYSPTIPHVPGGGGFGITPGLPQTRVEFRSVPAGANIFVDGSFHGQTPLITELYHGQRSISVQLEGFQTTVDTIVVTSGPMIPFEYEMQALPSSPQPGLDTGPPMPGGGGLGSPPAPLPPAGPNIQPPAVTPPTNTPVIPDPPAPPTDPFAPIGNINPIEPIQDNPGYFNNVPGYNPPVIGDQLTIIP